MGNDRKSFISPELNHPDTVLNPDGDEMSYLCSVIQPSRHRLPSVMPTQKAGRKCFSSGERYERIDLVSNKLIVMCAGSRDAPRHFFKDRPLSGLGGCEREAEVDAGVCSR